MITLNDFLKVPYVDHGRDLDGLDCYGQVFLARSLLFHRPLGDDYQHIHPDDKVAMTSAYFECLPNFKCHEPKPSPWFGGMLLQKRRRWQ